MRHDLHEASATPLPVIEQSQRLPAAGKTIVFVDQSLEQHFVDHAEMAYIHLAVTFEVVTGIAALAGHQFLLDRLQRHLRHIAARLEAAFLVEHVGHATGHARREVATGHPEHDDRPAGHVLATMITDTLDDGGSARVADGKALAGDTGERRLRLRSHRRERYCRR
jgi:hypothetical protein